MSNPIFVDGVAYDADDFGQWKSGVWVPKTFSGSYGTQGFHLDHADSSDLGNDVSGNANDASQANMTTNNQVTDSPTHNHACTTAWNTHASITQRYAGLYTFWGTASWLSGYYNFQPLKSGKWYWEMTQETSNSGNPRRCLTGIDPSYLCSNALKGNWYIGQGANGFSLYNNDDTSGADYRTIANGSATVQASLLDW
jgi:hypothetical protein